MLDIVFESSRQLKSWKDSLPVDLQPKTHLRQFLVSPGARPLREILIYCSYYDHMMALNAPFAYPWIAKRFLPKSTQEAQTKFTAQAATSSAEMADAARNIIIMARNFEMNGANTHA